MQPSVERGEKLTNGVIFIYTGLMYTRYIGVNQQVLDYRFLEKEE